MLVALGVSGGIGAYKAVEVARGLQKRGHDVVAIMTHSATRFVGAVTFEAITRRRAISDQWEPGANADIEHISLASSIDLLPANAPAQVRGPAVRRILPTYMMCSTARLPKCARRGNAALHGSRSSRW